MLTPQRLTTHLLSRGLLSLAIVDTDLRIVSRRRNNRNFEVVVSPRLGYFTKESRSGDSLSAEARFYTVVGGNRRAQPLNDHLPSFCDYDPDQGILVLQLIKDARDVSSSVIRNLRIGLRIASELGTAVAAIHDCDLQPDVLARADVPWVLSLPAPDLHILEDISAANVDLLRIVQRSRGLCRCLERLRRQWREVSLIHGDLRFANCLVSMRRRRARFALKIADWEMCGFGDPAWDVGCLFAAFLSLWVGSMSLLPDATAGALIRSARFPLRRVKPAIKRFWIAYSSARRFPTTECREFLLQSIRFAAACLVQSAYEGMQHASSISGEGVVLLQLAANIAARPRRAAEALLGLDLLR